MHDIDCLFCPQKQKLAKARRESETQRMRTRTMMMKTTTKSKAESKSLPCYPSSTTNPNVRPPSARTAFVIHVYPPSSELFLLGQDCTGWVGQVELHCHQALPLWNWEPPNIPQPWGSQASQHSAFHNFTVDPSLCIPVWGLWDWYLVFGSVLLIFCWMNYFCWVYYFPLFCLFFLLLIFPNKIIAIAAVQPASHDFYCGCLLHKSRL